MQHDQRLGHVDARFLEHRLGGGDVAGGNAVLAVVGHAAAEDRGAVGGEARVARHHGGIHRAVDRPRHRLAHLDVVERRLQVVHAHDRLEAELAHDLGLGAGFGVQQRQQVGRHALEVVDLAADQRAHLGLRIGHAQHLDAVELGDLGARGPVGRLAARLVVGELLQDDLYAGLMQVGAELVGTRAHDLLHLLAARRPGDALGHHERHRRAHLGEAVEHHAVGLLQDQLDRAGVRGLERGREAGQHLAHAVARRPAPDRGHAVGRRHRLAVVPFEARPQDEGVGELVGAHRAALDHLRLGLELVVDRKQRVVDQVAEIARREGRGEVRIEDARQGLGRDTQQGLRLSRRRGQQRSGQERHHRPGTTDRHAVPQWPPSNGPLHVTPGRGRTRSTTLRTRRRLFEDGAICRAIAVVAPSGDPPPSPPRATGGRAGGRSATGWIP